MELQYSERSSNIRFIHLIGRLDIMGVGAIETRFAVHRAGEDVRLIVDLSGLDYLAAIGIRLLTINAKSLASRGGRMLLLGPIPEARTILEVTDIPGIIPVYDRLESAEADLLAQ